jgi:two-component SAPR family response regulator
VKKINEKVDEIEKIEDEKAAEILEKITNDFSMLDILISVRLNGVKFSEQFIADKIESEIKNAG